LGYGLAIVEMKLLLALVARHYSVTCDNNTEWAQAIGRVPKVGWGCCLVPVCLANTSTLLHSYDECHAGIHESHCWETPSFAALSSAVMPAGMHAAVLCLGTQCP
jgi:hypothetical protein